MIGRIDAYFRDKGYGFIVSQHLGRTTYFFHVANVVAGEPIRDAAVEFDVAPPKAGTKRASATNIKVGA